MSAERPSVLLVDDVPANLVALEAQLESLECDIVCATSGNEALRQLLMRDFAVMLLDVQMPEMDGYEVARYARDNPRTRDVPILFVTANLETEEAILRGYGSGAVDYLLKPINVQILRSKVSVFVELYASRRKLADEIGAHKKTLSELEAFNYSVSHDLRAPLRPLDGFSQALLEDYGDKLDDTARDYLRRIRAAAQRMGQLIDDMLALSAVSRLELRRQSLDIAGLALSILEELRAAEPERVVEFASMPEHRVYADPRLLRIALENLLRNAWKFTRKQPAALIELGQKPGSDGVTFFVRDNGVGFDQTYGSKLFQPFQRLHGANEFEGTGIGLAIVKRIIGRHGGRAWAESVLGQSATFYFTLR